MELMNRKDFKTEARDEFKARLKAALALALALEKKLIGWGDRMEKRQKEKVLAD
jgi:hypothetical protein